MRTQNVWASVAPLHTSCVSLDNSICNSPPKALTLGRPQSSPGDQGSILLCLLSTETKRQIQTQTADWYQAINSLQKLQRKKEQTESHRTSGKLVSLLVKKCTSVSQSIDHRRLVKLKLFRWYIDGTLSYIE